MTVVLCSRDVEGDAGKRPVAGRSRGVAGGALPLLPRPDLLGPLGSRFWALADEFSDEEEQGDAELEVGSVAAELSSSPRSTPAQRTLAHFLGKEWCVVPPAGRRRTGGVVDLRSEKVSAGGRTAPLPSVESSPDLRDPVSWSAVDFPPLRRPAAQVCASASPQVLVGSVSVSLQVSSPAASRRSPAARRSPSGPRVGDEGDVALPQPSVSLGVVDPPSQCPVSPSPAPDRVFLGRPMVRKWGNLPGLARVTPCLISGRGGRWEP
jgi:hypothetical protein